MALPLDKNYKVSIQQMYNKAMIVKSQAAFLHIGTALNDENYLLAMKKLRHSQYTNKAALYSQINEYYGISLQSPYDLAQPLNILLGLQNQRTPSGYVKFNEEKHFFEISTAENITWEQFSKLFKIIQLIREQQGIVASKNKPPEKVEALYAIFLERRKGTTFPNIFKKYESKSLYIGQQSTREFNSSKSLEKYFSRYYNSVPKMNYPI